jgi:phage/plasmid-like protein (TIGR03299 family)
MAHELDFTLGRAAIAYRGQTPWHGFGIELKPDASIDEWRKAAGLDWEVREQRIFYRREVDGKGVPTPVPGRKALVRDDTQDVLSIVSDDYHVAQPSKVFAFFKELLKAQGLTMEVAGALKGGSRIWALARIDDSFTCFGQDRHFPYVLVATSFDGSISTQALLTITRVVCNNTITAAGAYDHSENGQSFKVRHNREFDIKEAHGKLGLNFEAWHAYCANVDKLARFQVSPDQALEFFYTVAGQGDEIVRDADNGNVISFPEPGRVVKQFINAYRNGPGAALRSSDGTAYGLVNAVTYYQDHVAPAADRGVRFDSATFGGGNVRKQHALEIALKMLEVA